MTTESETKLNEYAKQLRDGSFNPETLRVAIMRGLDTRILKKFINEVRRVRESDTGSAKCT